MHSKLEEKKSISGGLAARPSQPSNALDLDILQNINIFEKSRSQKISAMMNGEQDASKNDEYVEVDYKSPTEQQLMQVNQMIKRASR